MKQPAFLLMPAALIYLFLITSCTSVSKEELIPPGCDTVNMSYANDVVPILQAHCYTCHSAVNPASGFALEGYNNLHPFTIDTTGSRVCTLVGKISHDPGYTPFMPFNQPKLDTCLINQIVDWVNRGALDN
jgi:hypothetical protein